MIEVNFQKSKCRDNTDLFFTVGSTSSALETVKKAKAICYECPEIEICAQYAAENEINDGIWGGLTDEERRAQRRLALRDHA